MKNKIIIILIIAVVAIAALIGFYFVKQNEPSQQMPAGNQERTDGDGGLDSQINNEQSQSKLVTDDFDIVLPAGWKRVEPAAGTLAMAVNISEQLNDSAAQKINFRSYFAVSYDTREEESMAEYMQIVKNSLSKNFSNVIFANEQDVIINSRPARAVEADLTQQGAEFKILMVVIAGEGEDVWIISFNTAKSVWDGYKETFSDIARSFNLKK